MDAEEELSPDIGEAAAGLRARADVRERPPELHEAPEPIGLWAAYLAGIGWRPGSPTLCSTGLTIGVATLLQMVLQGAFDIDSAWRRLVTRMLGLVVQEAGAAVLVTLE
eukprot:48683-Alexandrium_andersonii.AAC.1